PQGGPLGPLAPPNQARDWTTLIETAISPTYSQPSRRRAAARALALAKAEDWRDNRRAFSHFVLARLSAAESLEAGLAEFAMAARFYRALPEPALHLAHVD